MARLVLSSCASHDWPRELLELRCVRLSQFKIMKTKYVNTAGTQFSKKAFPVIVKELKTIERDVGIITPQAVVARASNKSNPLHKYFTWNDSIAARKHREWEARMLIRSVSVTFIDSGGKEQAVRAFVNLKPDEESDENELGSSGYLSFESIKGNTNYENQVLRYAHNQLLGWKRRFGHFKEFLEVDRAIEHVTLK